MSPAWRSSAGAILAANLGLTAWVLWLLLSGQLQERIFVDPSPVSAFPAQPPGASRAAPGQGQQQRPPEAGDVPPPPPRQDLPQQAPR